MSKGLSRARGLGIAILRGLAALGAALALIAGLETALSASGYGQDPRYLKPVPGKAETYSVNPAFALRFFPGPWLPSIAPEPVELHGEGLHVVVLGESAAYGYPDPAFSFSRMLEVLLANEGLKARVENLALSGVNLPVLREMAHELLPRRPDVLVLYCGNNEFVGPYGPVNRMLTFNENDAFIRAHIRFGRWRLRQLLGNLRQNRTPSAAAGISPDSWIGEGLTPGDPCIPVVYERFRENLSAICAEAKAHGVKVILCTVPANERDFPPLASTFASSTTAQARDEIVRAFKLGEEQMAAGNFDIALRGFRWGGGEGEKADAIATQCYCAGKCLLALGRPEEARAAFRRAVDLDALQMRADARCNKVIAAVAEEQGVALADCREAFRNNSTNEIPGNELFYDYCHPNFAGHSLVAREIQKTLHTMGVGSGNGTSSILSDAELAARLGWTPWHERENLRYVERVAQRPTFSKRIGYAAWATSINEKIAQAGGQIASDKLSDWAAGKPSTVRPQYFGFRIAGQLAAAAGRTDSALAAYRAACDAAPEFAPALLDLARAEHATGDDTAAVTAYRRAIQTLPEQLGGFIALAKLLTPDAEAVALLEHALSRDPSRPEVWRDLARVHEAQGRPLDAIEVYRRALTFLPEHPGVLYYLAQLLAKHGSMAAARETVRRGLKVAPKEPGLVALQAELNKK